MGRRCAEPADAGNETLVMFSTEQRGGAVCGLSRAWPAMFLRSPFKARLVITCEGDVLFASHSVQHHSLVMQLFEMVHVTRVIGGRRSLRKPSSSRRN